MDIQKDIDQYLARTGQTFQELMSGAEAFGDNKIHELVIQANKENKKIVWHDDQDPEAIDVMSFSLENV